MDTVVVDTDVFSFLFKRDTRGALYRKHLDGNQLCISFATVAELYRWAVQHQWGAQRIAKLKAKFKLYTLLPYDDATAWEWAKVMSVKGRPVAVGDAWIAAGHCATTSRSSRTTDGTSSRCLV